MDNRNNLQPSVDVEMNDDNNNNNAAAAADMLDTDMTDAGTAAADIDSDDENNNIKTVSDRLAVREERGAKILQQHVRWGIKESIIRLDPTYTLHINHVKNAKITKKFFGEHLPRGWIQSAVDKNVEFQLQSFRLIHCAVARDELAALFKNGQVRKVFIQHCSASTQIEMKELAFWLRFATVVLIDLKCINFERPDWPKYLMQRDGGEYVYGSKLASLVLRNIPLQKFNPKSFEAFLQTVAESMDHVVTISFADKTALKAVKGHVSHVFQKVKKEQFIHYYSTQKFVVNWRHTYSGNVKNVYYVSKMAIQGPAVAALQEEINMERLELND